MSKTYYNENDPFAAAWLRELIKAGQIADGDVDERSIKEISGRDLKGFQQCHFFAGIGVWSYALRQAGWPDSRMVWTGSCPCQPFSAAGKKGGFKDDRHLWPVWYRLISESKPDTVFGEQVAAKDGLAWFDLVSTDLEGSGYTVGATDLCAAGLGAPHIRQRLYFVADSKYAKRWAKQEKYNNTHGRDGSRGSGNIDELAYAERTQLRTSRVGVSGRSRKPRRANGGLAEPERRRCKGADISIRQPRQNETEIVERRSTERLAEPNGGYAGPEGLQRSGIDGQQPKDGGSLWRPTGGFWREADWIPCIDGKARPVEPGTFPLATGIANRVGLLRGYGNALCAPVAQAFIESYLKVEKES